MWGPNISSEQYKEWLNSFSDIWLILPIFHTTRDFASAPERFFRELAERLPHFAWCHTMIAKLHYYERNYESAIEAATKALELESIQPQALRTRALGYEFLNDYPKAIRDYTRSIEIQPHDPITYLDRGVALKKAKRPHEAVADYTMAIKLMPSLMQAYNNRGSALIEIEEYQQAVRDFDYVSKNATSELKWQAKLNLITALIAKGDIQVAETHLESEDFRSTLSEQGEDGAEHYFKAMIAEHRGDTFKAVSEYINQWHLSRNSQLLHHAQNKLVHILNSKPYIVQQLDASVVSLLRKVVMESLHSSDNGSQVSSFFLLPILSLPSDYEELAKDWSNLRDFVKAMILVGLLDVLPKIRITEVDKFESVTNFLKPEYPKFPDTESCRNMWMKILFSTSD